MPALTSMAGGPITTVAPTTTATALSSIATGLTPAEHGLLGYRMMLGGEVLNVLRWNSVGGDDRRRAHPPRDVQPFAAFLGHDVPVISPAELQGIGVHRGPPARLAPGRLAGAVGDRRRGRPRSWRRGSASSTPTTAASTRPPTSAASATYYDAELRFADRLVADVLDALPPGAVLLVTADHGQVDVGDRIIEPDADAAGDGRPAVRRGRFRWWHARPGAGRRPRRGGRRALRRRRLGRHPGAGRSTSTGSGRRSPPPIAARLGDVALVAHEPVSFYDPADSGPFALVCRHGSLTPAEVLVPLLAGTPLSPTRRTRHDRSRSRDAVRAAGAERAPSTASSSTRRARRGEPTSRAATPSTSPAKVMRIGSMVKMLLEEVRAAPLDEPSRERLAEIYERSIAELSDALSPDLQHELKMLALPFRDGEVPTEGEIRVAKAQLVGWLEGLFHGIQATLFAQQLAARQQLEQIRQLPPGSAAPGGGPQLPPQERPGTYL